MAYMRGYYYVFKSPWGVEIFVSQPPGEVNVLPGHVRIPEEVMMDLAAKFWLELSTNEKEEYERDSYFEPYRVRARKKDEENAKARSS